jgi:hypothetical protein
MLSSRLRRFSGAVVLVAWGTACSSREDVLGEAPDETTAANQPGPGEGTFPGESCTGCARFDVPLSAGDQLGTFELSLPGPVDMTDTTITWRLKAVGFSGTSGRVAPLVRDGQGSQQCSSWTDLSDVAAWTNVTCEPSERVPGGADEASLEDAFDNTRVGKVGLQIYAGDVSAGAVYDAALVYVDSITFSDRATPDITFDTGIGDLHLSPEGSVSAPAGTSVAFLGP